MLKISHRTQPLQQSGIRAASQRCAELNGINLGQGVCDLPTPDLIKQAAYQAIADNHNTYSACEGLYPLREALAQKLADFNGINADPQTEILVSHGSTGAFVCAAMTAFNPGDEVILFEPFYGYHRNILKLLGVNIKAVAINLADFSINMAAFKKAIGPKTKGIIICTPCNPCGKVFSKSELQAIGKIVKKHNLVVITDEIYEYITYPGFKHISPATLPDFKDQTITISGFSKTYNMTGWRLGYAAGPEQLIAKMSLVNDLLYVCPTTPLQHAVLAALKLPPKFYADMQAIYLHKRDLMVENLTELGFKITAPQGAYYLLADFSTLGFADDEAAAKALLHKAKVAVVPGRAFYLNPHKGKHIVRFCFAQDDEKLTLALGELQEMMIRLV